MKAEVGPLRRWPGDGRPPETGGGSAAGRVAPEDITTWVRRWKERVVEPMPEEEARLVVEGVLEDLGGGHPENLDRAGRAWGRVHRSVSQMVGRLSSFREALAASGVDDPLKMHRALDRVTAAATEEVLHRLEHASRTDALTGVGNRRAFDETLQAALSAASRQGHDVTVVAVDLDGLKRINDTEGHAAGDAALLALVRAFYIALRDEDTIFRVGGDEFVILLPFTSQAAAEVLMERVARTNAPAFTWGAAGYPDSGTEAATLVEAADQELYRRRQLRRAPQRVRPPALAAALDSRSPFVRWAWVPAAAIVAMSLIATLLSTTTTASITAARHPHVGPATSGQHGSVPAGHGGGAGVQPSSVGAAGSSGGFVTGYSTRPTTSGSGGTAPSGGTGPAGSGGGSTGGGGGTSPSPPSPSAPSGGLIGLIQGVLAPVPVVGGSGGVLSDVTTLLEGSPSSSPSPSPTVAGASSATTPTPASVPRTALVVP